MAQVCNTAHKQPELFPNLRSLDSNTSLKQSVVHPSVLCTFTWRHRTFSPTLLTQFQNFLWAPDLIIRSTKSQIAAVGKGDRRPPSNYCNQRQVPQVSQGQRRAKLPLNLQRILKKSHAKTCLTLQQKALRDFLIIRNNFSSSAPWIIYKISSSGREPHFSFQLYFY